MVKKIIGKLELLYIKNVLAFLNPVKYEKKYRNWLSSRGVVFKGTPDHIDRTAYFDSADYSKIVIGNQTVISRNVLLLTHDYSITNALRMIGIHTWHNGGSAHVQGKIEIGDNSFIGANAIILPNTYIGNNCIIGGGVIKGIIPDGKVVIGNPGCILCDTQEYAEKNMYSKELLNYEPPS